MGLRRESLEQIGVLLSGVITVTLYAVAALLIIAPWGLHSHDMLGAIESAFFGFKLGEVTISLWSLLIALVLFGLGYTITTAVQNWLEKRYLPLTQLDQGLQASIRTSVGYIGFLPRCLRRRLSGHQHRKTGAGRRRLVGRYRPRPAIGRQ